MGMLDKQDFLPPGGGGHIKLKLLAGAAVVLAAAVLLLGWLFDEVERGIDEEHG